MQSSCCIFYATVFCLLFTHLKACKFPKETASVMIAHFYGKGVNEHKLENDVLISKSQNQKLENCLPFTENCCTAEAEKMYIDYKYLEDLGSVSKLSYIRKSLDTFFPIFIKPFMKTIEYTFTELFNYCVGSGFPPRQISSTISRLYSSIQSLIGVPKKSDVLASSIRNFFAETKLMAIIQLTGLKADMEHCLSGQIDLLNSFEIAFSKSTNELALTVSEMVEREFVSYLEYYYFFIEILSSIEKYPTSISCVKRFEQLFFCRLCREEYTTDRSIQNGSTIPEIIHLVGVPCPAHCLNVVRGCLAGLIGIRNQLNELTDNFLKFSQLMARKTMSEETFMSPFLSNIFVDELRAWTERIDKAHYGDWREMGRRIQERCSSSPEIPVLDSQSLEWHFDVAEFLVEATVKAARAETPQWTASKWNYPRAINASLVSQLRLEQYHSYLAMERLISNYMTPEKLFDTHIGEPCLLGERLNCWNGHEFHDEYRRPVEFTRFGQLNNPSVRVTNADIDSLTSTLGATMFLRTKEMRSVMHDIEQGAYLTANFDGYNAIPPDESHNYPSLFGDPRRNSSMDDLLFQPASRVSLNLDGLDSPMFLGDQEITDTENLEDSGFAPTHDVYPPSDGVHNEGEGDVDWSFIKGPGALKNLSLNLQKMGKEPEITTSGASMVLFLLPISLIIGILPP
uniref:Glypican-2 n=1 Tax=Schistocephalus solidus TaxID=70667 RepID=A0A0X3P9B9_SCHSO